MVGDA